MFSAKIVNNLKHVHFGESVRILHGKNVLNLSLVAAPVWIRRNFWEGHIRTFKGIVYSFVRVPVVGRRLEIPLAAD